MSEPFLKALYKSTIIGEMTKEFGYSNAHCIPKIEKIMINSAIDAGSDKVHVQDVQKDISSIAGQKAVITKAKKSISNFKLRQGMPVGAKVTLRGNKMYEFLLKFIAISLPRIRDFRGISNKFDGQGNYTIGIADHTIFPEINIDRDKKVVGMDISFVTTAGTDKEGHALMAKFGMPFRRKQ
ncbi:MAG: 50S ribosomal protein L5 [Puniceicoccales bacterium]|jgi:large subunit ribosomal protein L5|nr:50S ribosomal protein L5 [Puniceicoccales bacterium]